MDKIKLNWIVYGLCIVFLLSTLALSAQKGSLKKEYQKLRADVDNLLTKHYELKRQLEESNAKLTEEKQSVTSLKRNLDEANATIKKLDADKQALLIEIKALKKTEISP